MVGLAETFTDSEYMATLNYDYCKHFINLDLVCVINLRKTNLIHRALFIITTQIRYFHVLGLVNRYFWAFTTCNNSMLCIRDREFSKASLGIQLV
jgi:hypothetical protein